MTMALCLNCGEIKFGAFCTCDVCKADATGDENLDILFSDWSHELEILEHFGSVIKEIHSHCNKSEICFWAFMLYASCKDPESITITIKSEIKQEAEKVLSLCTLPLIFESLESEPL